MTDDRQVHAVMKDGSEVVRYNRAGKWYQEWPGDALRPAKFLRVRDAIALALSPEVESVRLGLSGGGAFDRGVNRIRLAAHARQWAMEQGDHS